MTSVIIFNKNLEPRLAYLEELKLGQDFIRCRRLVSMTDEVKYLLEKYGFSRKVVREEHKRIGKAIKNLLKGQVL